MKLRQLFGLFGRRPPPKTWGWELRRFDLPRDGMVEYAQWLHPGESPKTISQAAVDHLRRFIAPGDVVIDVGAHSGDSTIPLALAAGPAGCVLALEPNPYVFPVLEANARLNADRTRILALNFAATERPGPVTFEYSDEGYCNGGRHEGISRWRHGHTFPLTVRGERLADWLRREQPGLIDRLSFVKVDAEGYDLTVLQSMATLLADRQPFIRAEVYRHLPATRRVALVRFLQERGYRLHRVIDDTEYIGDEVTPAAVTRWRHFDLFAVPASRPI